MQIKTIEAHSADLLACMLVRTSLAMKLNQYFDLIGALRIHLLIPSVLKKIISMHNVIEQYYSLTIICLLLSFSLWEFCKLCCDVNLLRPSEIK